MKKSFKHLKILAVTALAVCGLSAFAASSASASIVPAKFSSTSIKLTGSSITFKKNGLEPKVCSIKGGSASGSIEGNDAWPYNDYNYLWVRFSCGLTTEVTPMMMAETYYDTVTGKYSYNLVYNGFSTAQLSPWGNWTQSSSGASNGVWTNGSGSTPSTIKFENAPLGYLANGSGTISMSGTFTVTTSTGGLLTLSH